MPPLTPGLSIIPTPRVLVLLPTVAAAIALGLALAPVPARGIDLFKRKPKTPAPLPEPSGDDLLTITRVQIHLDESLFTPGVIDGRMGEFTRKAVAHYNTRHGIEPIDNWGPLISTADKTVPNIFTTYQIREDDRRFVDTSLPIAFEAQAERKALPYRRVSEFVAERFHTDEDFLAKINPDRKMSSLRTGDLVKVPNVTPFKIEDLPKHFHFEKDALQPILSQRHVIVDTAVKIASIWESDGRLVASFPITPGKERYIHRGDWKLQNMVTTPEFRYDKSMLQEGKRSDSYLELPPGPNSPVGIIWCGTSKSGIGLHGTASPHTIGRSRSAGCIRFANWDAIRLPTLVRPGSKVTIR